MNQIVIAVPLRMEWVRKMLDDAPTPVKRWRWEMFLLIENENTNAAANTTACCIIINMHLLLVVKLSLPNLVRLAFVLLLHFSFHCLTRCDTIVQLNALCSLIGSRDRWCAIDVFQIHARRFINQTCSFQKQLLSMSANCQRNQNFQQNYI